MSVYTVLYSIAHLDIFVNKSYITVKYYCQINIYITYLLQLFLEVFELTQLTGQTGGQTCDNGGQYLLNVPIVSSPYFNKIKRMSHLGKSPALSLEILQIGYVQLIRVRISNRHKCINPSLNGYFYEQ